MADDTALLPQVSIVIPSYNRENVLIDTLKYLLKLSHPALEILLVDQTKQHTKDVSAALQSLSTSNSIVWMRLPAPSITKAMNVGAMAAKGEIILFLDDDIMPCEKLILCHAKEYLNTDTHAVAGQVIQPWEKELATNHSSYRDAHSDDPDAFLFNSVNRENIRRFIGCNVSFRRDSWLGAGGFDENFIRVAYRFEAEFAERFTHHGFTIIYSPEASLHHLKEEKGGTRSYGDHRSTIRPSHSVGRYYYFLTVAKQKNRWWRFTTSPFTSCATKFHLTHPWWIPITLLAEFSGMFWAIAFWIKGPQLIQQP